MSVKALADGSLRGGSVWHWLKCYVSLIASAVSWKRASDVLLRRLASKPLTAARVQPLKWRSLSCQ